MANKLQVINNAIILNGGTPLSELEGPDEQGNIAEIVYDDEVREAFSEYNWKWASITEPLIKDTSFTRNDYAGLVLYRYPNNATTIVDVWTTDNRYSVEYKLDQRGIWGPERNGLTVRFVKQLPEDKWTIWFQRVVESKIALRIAEKEDDKKVANLSALYRQKTFEARKNDNRQAGQIRTLGTGDRYIRVRNRYLGDPEDDYRGRY